LKLSSNVKQCTWRWWCADADLILSHLKPRAQNQSGTERVQIWLFRSKQPCSQISTSRAITTSFPTTTTAMSDLAVMGWTVNKDRCFVMLPLFFGYLLASFAGLRVRPLSSKVNIANFTAVMDRCPKCSCASQNRLSGDNSV
jgi:hypothetical protein